MVGPVAFFAPLLIFYGALLPLQRALDGYRDALGRERMSLLDEVVEGVITAELTSRRVSVRYEGLGREAVVEAIQGPKARGDESHVGVRVRLRVSSTNASVAVVDGTPPESYGHEFQPAWATLLDWVVILAGVGCWIAQLCLLAYVSNRLDERLQLWGKRRAKDREIGRLLRADRERQRRASMLDATAQDDIERSG